MVQDLRTFLASYGAEYPEEVMRVSEEVSARWEVTGLAINVDRAFEEPPVLVFERLRNHLGEPAIARHVVNLTASRARACRFVGAEPHTLGRELYRKGLASGGIAPVTVGRAEAPVKANVMRGEAIDLYRFGPLIHHQMDAGPYISAGFVLCYDLETGVDNSVMQRGWIIARDEIRWWPGALSDNYRILQQYERQGRDMPIACWIGHHPAAQVGSELSVPRGQSHLRAAGGVLAEPIRLVPSETLGDAFLVPADAEVVIEGVVPAGERRPEGPFGESYGHTGGQHWNPYIRVTAVTYRDDPYWVSSLLSHKDESSGVMLEKRSMIALEIARKAVGSVVDVRNSGHPGIFYVQVESPRPGEAIEAGLAVAASKDAMKMVIVVDADIDIYDHADIWLALASRVQWDRDIVVIPGGRGAPTDPSIPAENQTAKIVVDATKPAGRPFAPRNTVPAEVVRKMTVEAYVTPERRGAVRAPVAAGEPGRAG
jgi:UbiD family decarboxylase